MTFSVMITTRNRADDLAVTLRALDNLNPRPDELIITLDGCTDNSREVVAAQWPTARVFENYPGRGSIPARDTMLRAASSDLVLSLDDDSHPIVADFISKIPQHFARDERLAVLWFPQRSEEFPESLHQTDFGPDVFTGSYVSSGAVIRRSAYLATSGYARIMEHIYEEPDFSLQCIAKGWRVRLHTELVIRHHYSGVNRNELRIHHRHARNEAWSVLLRCPSPWWPFVLLRRAIGQLCYAAKRGPRWLVREPIWWWAAMRGAHCIWRQRTPVAWSVYRRWRTRLRTPETII